MICSVYKISCNANDIPLDFRFSIPLQVIATTSTWSPAKNRPPCSIWAGKEWNNFHEISREMVTEFAGVPPKNSVNRERANWSHPWESPLEKRGGALTRGSLRQTHSSLLVKQKRFHTKQRFYKGTDIISTIIIIQGHIPIPYSRTILSLFFFLTRVHSTATQCECLNNVFTGDACSEYSSRWCLERNQRVSVIHCALDVIKRLSTGV